MGPQQSTRPGRPLEARVVWYAACASVTLALVALMPSWPLRVAAVIAGGAVALGLAGRFLKGATSFSAALATLGSATFSVATVIWLSGLPWETGISWSQAGGVGRPTAWLFATTSLCFGAGVLATGRLMLQAGLERGDLGRRSYLLASLLPVISCAGFVVLALCPVGGNPVLAAAHNLASWAALGSFWAGMIATAWLRGASRALRMYSAAAAVVVFATWLPNGLRFLRLYEGRPISMLLMEVVVFPLCFGWLVWLAWEWRATTRTDDATPLLTGA